METQRKLCRLVKEGFNKWARDYDIFMERTNHSHARDQVLKGISKSHPFYGKILDAATGTGGAAIKISCQDNQVFALDFSERMLAKAERNAEKKRKSISFVKGDMLALPFKNGSFDVVLCCLGLRWMDYKKALSEFSRVAKPNGRIVLVEEFGLSGRIGEITKKIKAEAEKKEFLKQLIEIENATLSQKTIISGMSKLGYKLIKKVFSAIDDFHEMVGFVFERANSIPTYIGYRLKT